LFSSQKFLALATVAFSFMFDTIMDNSGCSGYPIISGRVVQVLKSSGNEKRYPITAPNPQIQVRVYPVYPKYIR